ncbi:unnamed protein product [Cyprideis torosa]|uniref:Uncharacterized protein n=1 Tax=Cyprideis torosa TaxID=163714 RepID=A0A7R8WNK5_9CRUS|nr:unnamed protein product [Cyprideis torosa]CAG0906308.1 unnamed protein product [Cyprideis torosa]
MPFQKEGIEFGIQKKGRILLADDMGLGKTIQSLGIALYYRDEWPLLIVCPSSMRYTWVESILRWVPSVPRDKIHVVTGGKDTDGIEGADIVIYSYNVMASHANTVLKAKRFRVVIMDESHFLKSYKSNRSKAGTDIIKRALRSILLTGTPALSRPIELYPQVSALDSGMFGHVHNFAIRYCDAKESSWGWNYNGCSNSKELQLILEERCMIRRMKSQVLSQLPEKRRQKVTLDPQKLPSSSSKEMKACAKLMKHVNLNTVESHGQLMWYFQQTGKAKVKAVCDYLEDLVEAEKKFLCFAHHSDVLDGICEFLASKKHVKYVRIDGSTSAVERQNRMNLFQYDERVLVAVLSITACNAGITMTSAQLVVFAELYWNPGILIQAEDRAHRIGQLDCVIVQYLLAQGTADDYIWPMIEKKLKVLARVGLSDQNFSGMQETQAASSKTNQSKMTDHLLPSRAEGSNQEEPSRAKVEGSNQEESVSDQEVAAALVDMSGIDWNEDLDLEDFT